MGLIAKQQAKKWLEPVQVPIGAWLDDAAARHPELSRRTLLHLAALDALARVDVVGAKSSSLGPGRYTSAQITGSLRRSLIRCEQVAGGTRYAVGTVSGAGAWRSDWRMAANPGDHHVNLTIVDHRTREDAIPNHTRIGATWEAYGAAIGQGCTLRVAPGPPDPGQLLADSVLPRETFNAESHSPYAHDYLLASGEAFTHGVRVYLPPGGLACVQRIAEDLRLPLLAPSDGSAAWIDLAGGRPTSAAWILAQAEGREALVFASESFAESGAMARHRTFRAAMYVLDQIERQSRERQPAVGPSIAAAMVSFGNDQLDDKRMSRFVPIWTNELPSPALPVSLPGGIPVAVRVQTSASNLVTMLRHSQGWLSVRQRTWASGLTQKQQAASRINGARRPYQLIEGGKTIAFVRYGQFQNTDVGGSYQGESKLSWFWEARLINSAQAPEPDTGRSDVMLLFSGLAHGDGSVAYGTEALAFIRAFVGQVTTADPDAICSTYYIGGSASG